jgi:hypothetical protein
MIHRCSHFGLPFYISNFRSQALRFLFMDTGCLARPTLAGRLLLPDSVLCTRRDSPGIADFKIFRREPVTAINKRPRLLTAVATLWPYGRYLAVVGCTHTVISNDVCGAHVCGVRLGGEIVIV